MKDKLIIRGKLMSFFVNNNSIGGILRVKVDSYNFCVSLGQYDIEFDLDMKTGKFCFEAKKQLKELKQAVLEYAKHVYEQFELREKAGKLSINEIDKKYWNLYIGKGCRVYGIKNEIWDSHDKSLVENLDAEAFEEEILPEDDFRISSFVA